MKNGIRWSDGVEVDLRSLIAEGGGAGRVESGGEGQDALFEGGILPRGIGRVRDRGGRAGGDGGSQGLGDADNADSSSPPVAADWVNTTDAKK